MKSYIENMKAMETEIRHFYLNIKLRAYLKDIINDLKKSDT